MLLHEKMKRLITTLHSYKKVIVAYSGGVDSTFLADVASWALHSDALSVTLESELTARDEIEDAKNIAEKLQLHHMVLPVSLLSIPEVRMNHPERCYYCKKRIFSLLRGFADEQGYDIILDGTTYSDKDEHRPGKRALRELGIISPLADLEFTKDDVRQCSRESGLPTWDKAAFACLATRFPSGTELTDTLLHAVEEAERLLRSLGFWQYRVRYHDRLARIELIDEDLPRVLRYRAMILDIFRKVGFTYVTLDLAGYRTGSMDA